MKHHHEPESKLDMTPMIDCVFLLLIFFLITMKPETLLAHLDVNRPGNAPGPSTNAISSLQIGIHRDGFTLNAKPVTTQTLGPLLKRFGTMSTSQTVLIQCSPDSPHQALVEALDCCHAAKLKNLSLVSF